MNNTIISLRNNQVFLKDSLNIVFWLGGSIPALFEPERLPHVFTQLRMRIVKSVLRNIILFKSSFISHEKIARQVGCSRNAVLDALKVFEDMGLFCIEHRGKKRLSNIYTLGPLLQDKNIVWRLRHVFSSAYVALQRHIERLAQYLNFDYSTIKNQDSTLFIKENVFNTNTSYSSYRKIENTTPVKEKRLYSYPFMPKDEWLHMKKALWADWSVTEQEFLMNKYEYQKFYHYSKTPTEDIQRKQKIQDYQNGWNLTRYPNTYKQQEVKSTPASYHKSALSIIETDKQIRECMQESNMALRVLKFESMLAVVPRESVPYIKSLIVKYKKKIQD